MCAPVLTAAEEQALPYIIYIIGSVGIVGIGSLGDVSLWLAAHISLGAALHGVALACQTQWAEQVVGLGVRFTRVNLGLCCADGLLEIAFVLGLLAYGDGLQQDVHVTGIVEYGVDACFQVLGILLHLGCILVDLQLLASCLGQTVELGLHGLGECGLGLSQCDGSLQFISTLIIVDFLHIDTAVIEASAKVLLDISGDDILALAQILGRDMHLLGVLSVSPSVELLQQMSVDIGLIGVIVAHIESIAQALVDLVEREGTAHPVVGVMALSAVALIVEVSHVSRPDALELGHIACVTHRHLLVAPHRIVEVGLYPALGLHTTVYHGVLYLLHLIGLREVLLAADGIDVGHVAVVEV